MASYLLSYPGPSWHIRGAKNFRSASHPPTDPAKARREWLSLADAIRALGGEVAVLAPPALEPPLTGLVYTANTGHLLTAPRRFLLSRMSAPHRQEEGRTLRAFFERAGIPVEEATHPWEGQAEITRLPEDRYLLSWGVRSTKESAEEVAQKLPPGSQALDVQLREPFFHGDTCLSFLENRAGEGLLLAYVGALVNRELRDIEAFGEKRFEIYPIHEKDALAYACNSLCVNGTVLAPKGLSEGLLEGLRRRGFAVEELDLEELFGKGGGGPRCLVNELGDLEIPAFARYDDLREAIARGE